MASNIVQHRHHLMKFWLETHTNTNAGDDTECKRQLKRQHIHSTLKMIEFYFQRLAWYDAVCEPIRVFTVYQWSSHCEVCQLIFMDFWNFEMHPKKKETTRTIWTLVPRLIGGTDFRSFSHSVTICCCFFFKSFNSKQVKVMKYF